MTKVLHYGPFAIDSELDLPELQGVRGSGRLPVTLRLGGVPESLPGGVPLGPYRQFAAGEFLLAVPGTGRFYVKDGREVRVEPAVGAPLADLAVYVLGSVFGALCHQNGLLPLHASAVEAEGRVTAFLGESGAGKSSLAALLGQRGHRIYADDICLLEPVGGRLEAAPLASWLKLWRGTFEQMGLEPEAEHRVFSLDDKYRVFLQAQDGATRPVRHFVFLERTGEGAAEPRLERLGAAEAIGAMVATIYPGYMPEAPDEERRLFSQCALALGQAEAFRLVRPWGWDRAGEALDLVEGRLLRAR